MLRGPIRNLPIVAFAKVAMVSTRETPIFFLLEVNADFPSLYVNTLLKVYGTYKILQRALTVNTDSRHRYSNKCLAAYCYHQSSYLEYVLCH